MIEKVWRTAARIKVKAPEISSGTEYFWYILRSAFFGVSWGEGPLPLAFDTRVVVGPCIFSSEHPKKQSSIQRFLSSRKARF